MPHSETIAPIIREAPRCSPTFANPFGADRLRRRPTAIQKPAQTLYYKGLRLHKTPVRIPRAPKPLSHIVRDFLLK
jgi:hypothetical protein